MARALGRSSIIVASLPPPECVLASLRVCVATPRWRGLGLLRRVRLPPRRLAFFSPAMFIFGRLDHSAILGHPVPGDPRDPPERNNNKPLTEGRSD